jgi:hypothetical protein
LPGGLFLGHRAWNLPAQKMPVPLRKFCGLENTLIPKLWSNFHLNSRKGVKTSPAVCYTICRIIFAITEIPFLITENKVILLLMPGGGYRFAALLSFQQPNFWGHLPKSLCRDVALVTSGGPGSAPRVPDRIPIWLILQCRILGENHATPELLMVYLDLHPLSSMYTKYNLPDNLH